MGNPILGDDSIGHRVSELLGELMEGSTVLLSSAAPVRLMGELAGFDRLVVVDSVSTGRFPTGTLLELEMGRHIEGSPPVSAHHLALPEVLEAGRSLGLPMPSASVYYGIEIEPPDRYTEELCEELASSVRSLAEEIARRECCPAGGAGRPGEPGGSASVCMR